MRIYFALFVWILLLYFFIYYGMKKRKWFLSLAFFSVFLIMALRAPTVGVDIRSYQKWYLGKTIENTVNYLRTVFPSVSFLTGDPLFFYFCLLVKRLGFSWQAFLALFTALCLLPFLWFYKKHSTDDFTVFFGFLTIGAFPMLLSGLRQSMAMSLSIMAFDSLLENDKKRFFLYVILASGFHVTALMILFGWVLFWIMKKLPSWTCLGISTLAGLVGSFLVIRLLSSVNLGIRFGSYIENRKYTLNPLVLVLYLGIAAVYLYFYQQYPEREELLPNHNTLLINCKAEEKNIFRWFCVGIFFVSLSFRLVIISRFANYFLFVMPLMLARGIGRIRRDSNRIAVSLSCFLVEMAYFIYTTPGSEYRIATYQFFWQA